MSQETSLAILGKSYAEFRYGKIKVEQEIEKITQNPAKIVIEPLSYIGHKFDVNDDWTEEKSQNLIIEEEYRENAIIAARQQIRKYCALNIARGAELTPNIYEDIAKHIGPSVMEKTWPRGFNGEEAIMFIRDAHGFVLITNHLNGIIVYDNIVNWYRYNMPVHVSLVESISITNKVITTHEVVARAQINISAYNKIMTSWAIETINLIESSKFGKIINSINVYIEHHLPDVRKHLPKFVEAGDDISIPISTALCSIRTEIPLSEHYDPAGENTLNYKRAQQRCWAREYGDVSDKIVIHENRKQLNGKSKQYKRSLRDIVAIEQIAYGFMYGALTRDLSEKCTWNDLMMFINHKLPK
jgi:hypothetical protein